jgi:trk system potassium uptake protein
MTHSGNRQHHLPQTGIRGAILTGIPLPFLFAFIPDPSNAYGEWRFIAAALAVVLLLLGVFYLVRAPIVGKVSGLSGCLLSYAAVFPALTVDPTSTLLVTVSIFWIGFTIIVYRAYPLNIPSDFAKTQLFQRTIWAMRTLIVFSILFQLMHYSNENGASIALGVSGVISLVLFSHWVWKCKSGRSAYLHLISSTGLLVVLLVSYHYKHLGAGTFLIGTGIYFWITRKHDHPEGRIRWWDLLLDNPARVLLSTFLFLCFLGAFLLAQPIAAGPSPVSVLDACFTSVSAVCVTGLVVLDTPGDFSSVGKIFILMLIQLGGLGIMSIATLSLQALGRRLSLGQEKVFAAIANTDQANLQLSLLMILKFTMICELIGTGILTYLFAKSGDPFLQALWRGLFTSVSAFCNAGFALQSDSLISYQSSPFILNTIALLIILGGMAPATALAIPQLIKRKRIPVAARIALFSTVILLVSGTFFILLFEWDGVLSSFSGPNKLLNAWFQSVTLRTAGFNSVDINNIANPTLLLMVIFMFIGGSPGGTAGGIKTTTFAILIMTFWNSINNRKELIYQNRHIHPNTIFQAITIFFAGALVWLIILLMLDVTQAIPTKALIFETASAIGTVGLSTGATHSLDAIGKIIVMVAMFTGRIGPITFFMLLSDSSSQTTQHCPKANINLN